MKTSSLLTVTVGATFLWLLTTGCATSLHDAATQGDVEVRGKSEATALHLALMRCDADLAERLMAQGADVNATCDNSGGPTIFFTVSGIRAVVENKADQSSFPEFRLDGPARRLLDTGVSFDPSGKLGGIGPSASGEPQRDTVLSLAFFDERVVGKLLEKGASVGARNQFGWTPLHLAVWNGYESTADLLIRKGLDVNSESANGQTPLHILLKGVDVEVVARRRPTCLGTVQGAPVETEDKDVHVYVMPTCPRKLDLIKLLTTHGAKVNLRAGDGFMPLHWAAHTGDAKATELLLAAGAEVNARSTGAKAPGRLVLAGLRGLSVYLGRGQPNMTIWAVSLREKDGKLSQPFVIRDADLNIEAGDEYTPLHLAAMNGHADVVKVLVSHGADTTAKDKSGRTTLDLANAAGRKDVAALLTH